MVLLSPSRKVWVENMRSPDRGTHHEIVPRSFSRCSNYIAKIVSQNANLFPDYLLWMNSSVRSENAAAHGQSLCVLLHCTIVWFFDDRALILESRTAKKWRKNVIDHDDQTRFEISHQTPCLRQFQWCTTPLYYQGKVPWTSDCPPTTSFQKIHPFSPEPV